MNAPATKLITTLVFLLGILLAAAAYYPGLTGDYMFDDMPNLLKNKRLEIASFDTESIKGAALSSGSGPLRRPVSMLSFAMNRHFFGIAPYSYKVVNLIIHLLTGIGLFILSRLLIRSYRDFRQPSMSGVTVAWLPVVISALWLVHPLNLTSVLYIVQRMTSLSTLFMVFGLCLYVIGRRRMLSGISGLPIILTGLMAFGGLSILSKESGALLPLYMAVIEITLFRSVNHEGHLDKSIIGLFTLIVAVPACLFLLHLANTPGFLSYDGRNFTLIERLLTEARVLVFYLKMIIMPSISELGLYHDDIVISKGLLDPPSTLFSLLGIIGILLAAVLLLRKRPLISLGIFWFFAGHTLESTIIPLEIAHEHRNYLANFGILLAATSAVTQTPLRRLGPAIRITSPLMFLVLFTSTTWLRASQWSDNVNHTIYEAIHHPNSYRAVYSAGRIHSNLALQGEPGHEEKAFTYLSRANELSESGIMPLMVMLQLSFYLEKQVKHDWYEEMIHRLKFYPLTPSNLDSLRSLAECYGDKCKVPLDIIETLFDVVSQNNSSNKLKAEAATIYGTFSINKRGNFNKGLELFIQAVELDRRDPQRWINLIKLLTVMQNFDEAEKELASFRTANTFGGNEKDYFKLEQAIATGRENHRSSANSDTRENI